MVALAVHVVPVHVARLSDTRAGSGLHSRAATESATVFSPAAGRADCAADRRRRPGSKDVGGGGGGGGGGLLG